MNRSCFCESHGHFLFFFVYPFLFSKMSLPFTCEELVQPVQLVLPCPQLVTSLSKSSPSHDVGLDPHIPNHFQGLIDGWVELHTLTEQEEVIQWSIGLVCLMIETDRGLLLCIPRMLLSLQRVHECGVSFSEGCIDARF